MVNRHLSHDVYLAQIYNETIFVYLGNKDLINPKVYVGFPGASAVKNMPANAGVSGSIPGSGRSPREGNGNLL